MISFGESEYLKIEAFLDRDYDVPGLLRYGRNILMILIKIELDTLTYLIIQPKLINFLSYKEKNIQ